VVSEANASARRRELEALAPTRLLPWLTLAEIAASIRELGKLTHDEAQADSLAARLWARLSVPAPANGPRVLLVLGENDYDAQTVWFIRENSLHGAALHAAGARNAVAEDVMGPPQLSNERLLALDPDAIIILRHPGARGAENAVARSSFARFPSLTAVKNGRVASIEAPEAFANGPRILSLVDRLHAELVRLGVVAP
jgi:iron complex transport system substrate-binding protein